MNYEIGDVDLDVSDRDAAISALKNVVFASQLADSQLKKHATGIYLQKIPVDPINKLSAFPYDIAEIFGYYKIDIIPNYLYDGIDNEKHLNEILSQDIDWDWFLEVPFVRSLFHFGGMVNKDFSMAQVVSAYEPKSIDDLACLVAIKLPGKKYLIGESMDTIREKIWVKEEGMMFKKSHSYAYALTITVDAKVKAPEYFGVE